MAGGLEDGYYNADKEKGQREEDGEIPRSNGDGHAIQGVRNGDPRKAGEGNGGKEYAARRAGGIQERKRGIR